jgi:hypothetical protein
MSREHGRRVAHPEGTGAAFAPKKGPQGVSKRRDGHAQSVRLLYRDAFHFNGSVPFSISPVALILSGTTYYFGTAHPIWLSIEIL